MSEKKSIIELLGIKPIEREYNSLLDEECFYEDNIREVEEQRDKLLVSLVSYCMYIEKTGDYEADEEWVAIIEAICHPLKWPEIKEIINAE